MRTRLMIMLVVGALFLVGVGVLVGLIVWLGWLVGAAVGFAGLALLMAFYLRVVRPWHSRWGATDQEATMAMPGDQYIGLAGQATRAISIDAEPQQVWPWLVQLGYGKAGWYSYDWIDNDFKSSADRIVPDYQHLEPGEKILMMPEMGFVVREVDEPRSIVSVLEDGSTSWSLGLYPEPGKGTRLVSRWRPRLDKSPASVLMNVLVEPGSFIMEQKMLRSIRDRVEGRASPAKHHEDLATPAPFV